MSESILNGKVVTELKRIAKAYSAAPISIYSAAVAYYTVFSLAPILIITIGVIGFFINGASARAHVLQEVSGTFGKSGTDFITTLIDSHTSAGASIGATVIGVVFILIGALGIFGSLQTALDAIYESLPEKNEQGFMQTLLHDVISLGMVFSIGFVLLVSLAASALLSAFGNVLDQYLFIGPLLISVISSFVSFVLISFFLGALLKFLPSHHVDWKPAISGGIIAGLFFIVGKFVLSLYFSHANPTSSYGAASSIILIILWAYYLSQVFFFSAVLTRLYFIPHTHKRAQARSARKAAKKKS